MRGRSGGQVLRSNHILCERGSGARVSSGLSPTSEWWLRVVFGTQRLPCWVEKGRQDGGQRRFGPGCHGGFCEGSAVVHVRLAGLAVHLGESDCWRGKSRGECCSTVCCCSV